MASKSLMVPLSHDELSDRALEAVPSESDSHRITEAGVVTPSRASTPSTASLRVTFKVQPGTRSLSSHRCCACALADTGMSSKPSIVLLRATLTNFSLHLLLSSLNSFSVGLNV